MSVHIESLDILPLGVMDGFPCTPKCTAGLKVVLEGDRREVRAYCPYHNFALEASDYYYKNYRMMLSSGDLLEKVTSRWPWAMPSNTHCYFVHIIESWLLMCPLCELSFIEERTRDRHLKDYHGRADR